MLKNFYHGEKWKPMTPANISDAERSAMVKMLLGIENS